MARFRKEKNLLLEKLLTNHWQECANVTAAIEAVAIISPLQSLLPRPEYKWRAAWCIGRACAVLAGEKMEAARNIMRRFLWCLNEESGGVGWGIPEAFGCAVAQSPALSREFARILISFAYSSGKSDNYIDHAPLRLGVFWAIGHFASSMPGPWVAALPALVQGLNDPDPSCQGMAVWACATTAEQFKPGQGPLSLDLFPQWQAVAKGLAPLHGNPVGIEVFEKLEVTHPATGELAQRASRAVQMLIAGA